MVMASKAFSSQLRLHQLAFKEGYRDWPIKVETLFLHSKDETPEVLKDFLTMIQKKLQALVVTVRTDRGTEFLNKTLNAFFKEEGIEHQTSTARTPEQNGVVERWNCTLVEAARTMLLASQLPLFFWAEAIETACYTQNRSIIILTHDKTLYHIINDSKPSIKHLHIFGCICYINRDVENLDKMKENKDQCVLVGYSTQSKGYRVYNKRTMMILDSIHICFDEIKEVSETSVANNTSGLVSQRQKASNYDNPDPIPQRQDVFSSADEHVPSQQELDLLFSSLYDEFFNASSTPSMTIQSTSAPSTHTNVHAEENNNDQVEEREQLQDDEFTNPFSTPAQEEDEPSSHNTGQSIGTPMATKPKLDADLSGIPVDQTDYLSKIRSLMYLTSSRPDIVQKVCFCARYQSRPTKKYLNEVKRIFRYLRGTGHMGLWYPKDSSFELTAFLDADHAGCIDSRKSTYGGIQFIGDKLVSWMSKKQNCTAMSSAKAEYMALSASCAQVM
nr:retrovirus-related Pol polyprotein from transposon TNT 1-94 [Tanacetum cinerariifolium]